MKNSVTIIFHFNQSSGALDKQPKPTNDIKKIYFISICDSCGHNGFSLSRDYWITYVGLWHILSGFKFLVADWSKSNRSKVDLLWVTTKIFSVAS
jgi:hypothetical protein